MKPLGDAHQCRRNGDIAPLAVCLDCHSVNQTFAHHRKRIFGGLPMSVDKADTRPPAAVIEYEAGADGAVTVCDALHVANPMSHGHHPAVAANILPRIT